MTKDVSPKEHRIVDDEGKEFVQKPFNIDDKEKPRRRSSAMRVKVYNKLRTRLHCSDCVLEAESEGSILRLDLKIPGIAKNVIKVA